MTAPSRYLSCFFLDVSGELPPIPTIYHSSTSHGTPIVSLFSHSNPHLFTQSQIQTWTTRRFHYVLRGSFALSPNHPTSTRQVLETGFLFYRSFIQHNPRSRHRTTIVWPYHSRSSTSPTLIPLSLCRTFLCFLFFSLCFSTYSPQYCATLSYYFLAVGFNNELQFAWLGISFPCWITCLQILSPMGFRLHYCSSRFRILRRAHMSRRALLTWGSTHGESRLGGVACRDVRLYPRIGDDSRIWWIFLGLGSTDVWTSGSIILLYVYSLCCIFYSLECSGGLVIIFFGPWTDILDWDCHSIFSLNSMFGLDSKSTAMW